MSRAITAKVATSKVIDALNKKLVSIKEDKANEKVNEKAFNEQHEAWLKDITALALTHISKAEDVRANLRYNNTLSVSFDLPASVVEGLPKEPTKDYNQLHDWQYKEIVEEIENALNIFRMTDDEYVNASTMKNIAKYL